MRVFLCAVSACLAVAARAPAASADSFGLPLGAAPFNAAPNNPADCDHYLIPILNVWGTLPGATGSCIWIHVPTPADVQAAGGRNISLEPPGTGTVTQVQVSVGPVTGAMQVVVMRALYENTITPGHPNDACCIPVAASRVFTPTANAITTVPVSLPVREDATPPPDDLTTIADFDTLGLAVLEPGVPVPMYYTGNTSDPADFVWNTSQPSTITPGFTTDAGGFFVAMSADWAAAGAGGGGGGGGAGGGGAGGGGAGGGGGGGLPLGVGLLPGAALPINLGNGIAPVRNGNANVGLRCVTAVSCIGQLLLQNAAARGAKIASATRRLTTFGQASFKISAHGRKTVSVHLNSRGNGLLARRRSTKAWANVKLSTGARYAVKITLKR